MTKLFHHTRVATEKSEPALTLAESVDPKWDIDTQDDIESLERAGSVAFEQLAMGQHAYSQLRSAEAGSAALLGSLSAYSPLVQHLGVQMGVRSMPSLEDAANPYSAQHCKDFALEGFKSFIANAWKRIRDFFRDFFKKVSLLLRRLVGASLQLDEYEKYCEKMIAKLVSNKATCKDNSKLASELPKMLALPGMVEIDSDYLLSGEGGVRVKGLLMAAGELNGDGPKGGADFNKLQLVQNGLTALLGLAKDTNTTTDKILEGCSTIKSGCVAFMGTLFGHQCSLEEVPREVYTRFNDVLSSTDIRDKSVTVGCLRPPSARHLALPRDRNLFMICVEGAPVVAAPYITPPSTASNKVGPIENLNNLKLYYDEYRAGIAKLNVKKANDTLDRITKECDRILQTMAGPYQVALGSQEVFGERNMEVAQALTHHYQNARLTEPEAAVAMGNIFQFHISPKLTNNLDTAINTNANDPFSTQPGKEAIDELLHSHPQELNSLLNNAPKVPGETRWVGRNHEDQKVIHTALEELNKWLGSFFSALQVGYSSIARDIYAQAGELRFEMIKYIYYSAKRYSY